MQNGPLPEPSLNLPCTFHRCRVDLSLALALCQRSCSLCSAGSGTPAAAGLGSGPRDQPLGDVSEEEMQKQREAQQAEGLFKRRVLWLGLLAAALGVGSVVRKRMVRQPKLESKCAV